MTGFESKMTAMSCSSRLALISGTARTFQLRIWRWARSLLSGLTSREPRVMLTRLKSVSVPSSTTQWAAVRMCWSLIRVPPQVKYFPPAF